MTKHITVCCALALLLLSNSGASPQKQNAADWGRLKFFVGTWNGVSHGRSGAGKVARSYNFGIGGTFLVANNCSVYPKQKDNPTGEVHVDHTVIGFDKVRNKFVMRQFHVEGFVNQYVLDEVSPDGKKLVWTTESIENIPTGWQAREAYLIRAREEFAEIFELREPGKNFELYSRTDFKRSVLDRHPGACKF